MQPKDSTKTNSNPKTKSKQKSQSQSQTKQQPRPTTISQTQEQTHQLQKINFQTASKSIFYMKLLRRKRHTSFQLCKIYRNYTSDQHHINQAIKPPDHPPNQAKSAID